MIAPTARHAETTSGKIPSSVSTRSGRGIRRTVISVTIPSVPSLPTTAPTRSKPLASPLAFPSRTISPSGSTSSSASTWFVVVPYFSVCGPPEFSATLPPIVHDCWLEGSGA